MLGTGFVEEIENPEDQQSTCYHMIDKLAVHSWHGNTDSQEHEFLLCHPGPSILLSMSFEALDFC